VWRRAAHKKHAVAACWAGLLLEQQVVGDDQCLVGIGEGGLVTHQVAEIVDM